MKKKTNSTPKATQDRVEQRRAKNIKKSPKPKPPPAKPVPGRPLAWESKSHRLEINPPIPPTVQVKTSRSMHMDDLSTTEDDDARETTSRYKKSIDALLNDVAVNEREYIEAKTSEQLNASRRVISDQRNELKAYRDDLNVTSRNCDDLRRSVEVSSPEMWDWWLPLVCQLNTPQL